MHVRPRFRVIGATIAALLPILALSACGSTDEGGSGSSSGPFKIVLISDLSGALAGGSKPGAAGVEVAVETINKSGGIDGRKIDLKVIDGQSNPDIALAAAQKAVASNPYAVLLFGGSASASKLTPLLQQAKVPFISGALGDESIYPAQSGIYQPGLTAKQNGNSIYQFLKAKLGDLSGKTIGVAAINSPFVDTVIKTASKQLEADGAHVRATERYDFGIASFTTQAGKIARDNPDAVLTLGATDDTILVSKALNTSGSGAIQVGMAIAADPEVLEQIGSANYWALTENSYARDAAGFVAAADKLGRKNDIIGSTFSSTGWVAANFLAEALKNCASGCDASKLNAALQNMSGYNPPGDVAYGPITFGADDHVGASIVKFHNYDPKTKTWSESDPIDVE